MVILVFFSSFFVYVCYNNVVFIEFLNLFSNISYNFITNFLYNSTIMNICSVHLNVSSLYDTSLREAIVYSCKDIHFMYIYVNKIVVCSDFVLKCSGNVNFIRTDFSEISECNVYLLRGIDAKKNVLDLIV